MKSIYKELLSATSARDITDALENLMDKDFSLGWVEVGGRRNNISTINIGTDPAAGVTERITNAIDAVLEKEWKIQGEPTDILSPRIAAREWFNIENGQLNTVVDARDKRIQEIGSLVKVTLKDSGKDSYPTVEIRDKGIGLRADDFAKTILSLNEGNKINKLHLLGAYGQGGSTALSYNVYTLIMSKPFFKEKGEKPVVAWTVVRINEGDVETDKQPWYEYLIDKDTGKPFTVEVSDKDFEPGTIVRHIHMDLAKYKSAMTNLTGSLWYLSHHYLFNTVIPFTISDERKKLTKDKIENRKVFGNNRRLTTSGKNVEYQNKAELTFGNGQLTVYWWVLSTEGTDDPRNRITQYSLASKPIIITFNGQKQGALPNTLIKKDLKLPFLERYILVEVECDRLDNESKRQLFSSTRETTRETSIKEELRQTVIDTLQADGNLVLLDKARRERYLKAEDTDAMDHLRKRLAARVNVFLKGSGGGGSVTATDTKETTNAKKQPEIPIQDPPTYLEITTPAPREVHSGKTFHVKFKTDAHPNYVYDPDTFVAVIEPHSFGSFTGTARVVDGYGIAYFKAKDITVGDLGEITLEIRPPREKTLRDSVESVCIELPEGVDSNKKGSKGTPNINPHWVGEKDQMFKEENWDKLSVAKVDETSESVEIFVSEANKNLTKLLERAQRYSTETVDDIKNRYLEHIAFYAFMTEKNGVNKDDEDLANVSPEIIGKIKQRDLRHASETVCGILDDFFQAIVIESSSKSKED